MYSNILIIYLSNDIENKSNVRYEYKNKIYENKYQLEVLFDMIEFDKIICFGAVESSWDYLYQLMYKKYISKDISSDVVKEFKEYFEVFEEEALNTYFNEKAEFRDRITIKYFKDDLDTPAVMSYFEELKSIIFNTEKITLDITAGPRFLPILILQLLNTNLEYNNKIVELKVLYGKRKNLEKGNKDFKILELEYFDEIFKFSKGFSLFSKYGDPTALDVSDELKEKLHIIYLYSNLNFLKDIIASINDVDEYPEVKNWKLIKYKLNEWSSCITYDKKEDFRRFEYQANLVKYQNLLNNTPLAILSMLEEINKKNDNSRSKELEELGNIRNMIVHPYNKVGSKNRAIPYNKLLEIVDSSEFRITEEKKKNEVLLVGIGNTENYKEVNVDGLKEKTLFSFRALLERKNMKYKKVIFFGISGDFWVDFLEKFSKELKKDIVLETTKNLSYDQLYKSVNNDLKKIDGKFEAIIFENTDNEFGYENYFNKFIDEFIKLKDNYTITYDITYLYRELMFFNFLILHYLEIIGKVKVENITYFKLEGEKSVEIKMDVINNLMWKYKMTEEYINRNKFDANIDFRKDVKEVMKKVSIFYDFNQVTALDNIRGEVQNLETNDYFENKVIEHIRSLLVNKEGKTINNREEKFINMAKKQLKLNNLAQSLFILSDLVFNYLLEFPENEKNNLKFEEKLRYKKIFFENSAKYGFKELEIFYKQNFYFLYQIRNEAAHVNANKRIKNNNIKSILGTAIKKFEDLYKNKSEYTKLFKEKYLKGELDGK